MKYFVLILFITTTLSCKKDSNIESNYKVGYFGALKNMMHKGDVSAKVDLNNFKKETHLYALGALENLKGEIQIFNSKPTNTIVVDNKLSFSDSYNKKASLFVYAKVKKWKTIKIPETIIIYKELEDFIKITAKANNIDVNKPFPFLIDGTAKAIDWHVINWKDGDMDHSHQKHINSGLHGTITDRKVNMLGFYSNAHHAIFTHHTTNIHIHLKTTDNKLAGHVDGLELGKGMVLKLPIE